MKFFDLVLSTIDARMLNLYDYRSFKLKQIINDFNNHSVYYTKDDSVDILHLALNNNIAKLATLSCIESREMTIKLIVIKPWRGRERESSAPRKWLSINSFVHRRSFLSLALEISRVSSAKLVLITLLPSLSFSMKCIVHTCSWKQFTLQ